MYLTHEHVGLLPFTRGGKRYDQKKGRLEAVNGGFISINLPPGLGGVVLAQFHGGLVTAWVRSVPRGNSTDGVGKKVGELVQLHPLPNGGLVENLEGLGVEAREIGRKKGLGRRRRYRGIPCGFGQLSSSAMTVGWII